MARRVSLPAADDLFRRTAEPEVEAALQAAPATEPATEAATEDGPAPKKPSGRVRHDEKMTVYVTSDELLDIEHARLDLRRHHGLGVDRGRIVRAAVALALEELDENGAESQLLRRLRAE